MKFLLCRWNIYVQIMNVLCCYSSFLKTQDFILNETTQLDEK